jgi:hypothetical protein
LTNGRAGGDRARRRHRRGADLIREVRLLAAAEDSHPDEAQQRRRQGDGDEHGDRHGDGADGPHQAKEPDPGHVEGEQRDDDRRSREEHGVAGGAVRQRDRLSDRVTVPELAPVPVDDEQRVVDPDREPEHHAEDRRHRDHVDDAGEG